MTVHYEGIICYSIGSRPSEANGGGWVGFGKDGGEPVLLSSMRLDVSPITEIEMPARRVDNFLEVE